MRSPFLRLALLSAPLLLSACGEGWEFQKTTDYFPYGNQRTAGSGVAYVRAKMMPQKELKVEEPVTQSISEPPQAVDEPKTALDAEKIFNEYQGKGHMPKPVAVEPADEVGAREDQSEDHSSNLLEFENGLPAHPQQFASASGDVLPSDVQPQAGGESFNVYTNDVVQPAQVVMPESQIISPKQDFLLLSSEGQRSLAEIYDDTF